MTAPYPTLDALMARQTEARRTRAVAAARAVLAWLAEDGVEARVIGSLARGTFKRHSDVDVLVLSCPPDRRYRIEAGVEERMGGLPFDVVYLDEVEPAQAERLQREAVDASDLC